MLDFYISTILDNAFHDCITISGRAYVDFVVNFFRAMSASPFAKNVLRMFEAHFWKKNKIVEPQ